MEFKIENNSLYAIMDNGDILETRNLKATSPVECFQKCCELINGCYKIIETNNGKMIYLPPENYWFIYKRVPRGKDWLKRTSFVLNDEKMNFCPTSFYFEDHFEEDYGVYGIKYNEEIIYIGMTKQDFEARWEQHRRAFETGEHQKLYTLPVEVDKLEFVVLVSANDLKEQFHLEQISAWMLQIIEYSFIQYFKPVGNVAGNVENYYINGIVPSDISGNYMKIFKKILETEDEMEVVEWLNKRME